MKIFEFARSTLLDLTVTLLLQSSVAFIIGILLYVKPNTPLLLLDLDEEQLEEISSKLQVNIDLDLINLGPFVEPIAVVLMIVGAATIAAFVLGVVAIKSENAIVMAFYASSMIAILFTALIISATCMWDKPAVKDVMRPGLQRTLKDYVGGRSADSTSVTWNAFMLLVKCCGVDSYRDFQKLKNWQSVQIIHNVTLHLLTPLVCCKERANNISCASKGIASEKNNWAVHGCLDVVTTKVTTSLEIILYLLFLLIQLLVVTTLSVFVLTDLTFDALIALRK